ncbi:MAG: hypothetical protein M3Z25_18300 [Actinomycetota bacterium]|nr:hypothetical protein [Actinomycetota bacterium]
MFSVVKLANEVLGPNGDKEGGYRDRDHCQKTSGSNVHNGSDFGALD